MIEYLQTLASFTLHKSKRRLLQLCLKLKGKTGLEIGGPSTFFLPGGYFPIYFIAKKIDVVNYSTSTVWEGKITEGNNFNYYKNRQGHQYVSEASKIDKIQDGSYDFILSCHSLEHIANPIKALKEWKRLLNKEGLLMLVLPKKESTFDNQRDYTSFEHLVNDFKLDVDEKDDTHYNEVLTRHDLNKDPGITSWEELKKRTFKNYENRCVHHHVFNFHLVKEILEYTGFSVLMQQEVHNFHLVTIAQVVI